MMTIANLKAIILAKMITEKRIMMMNTVQNTIQERMRILMNLEEKMKKKKKMKQKQRDLNHS
jgi:hypothetical protein